MCGYSSNIEIIRRGYCPQENRIRPNNCVQGLRDRGSQKQDAGGLILAVKVPKN